MMLSFKEHLFVSHWTSSFPSFCPNFQYKNERLFLILHLFGGKLFPHLSFLFACYNFPTFKHKELSHPPKVLESVLWVLPLNCSIRKNTSPHHSSNSIRCKGFYLFVIPISIQLLNKHYQKYYTTPSCFSKL